MFLRRRGGRYTAAEGCLSLRHRYGPVERDVAVVVRAYDLRDRTVRIEAAGYVTRCLQHEIDHLDGIMFTDRMADPARDLRYIEGDDPTEGADGAT